MEKDPKNELAKRDSGTTQLHVISDEDMEIQNKIMRVTLGLSPDVPDEVVKATVLLALQFGLSAANKEIQIIKTGWKEGVGDIYSPYVGVGGLTRSARRQAPFTHKETVIEADELKELRGGLYDEMDVGIKVTLWRTDVARECRLLEIPYHPSEAVGLWRVKANQRTNYKTKEKYWLPDNIPNTMTRNSKAAQRGLRAAIKKAYDLAIPDELLEMREFEASQDRPQIEVVGEADTIEGTAVVLTEDLALLIDAYGIANVDKMDDVQREQAVKMLRQGQDRTEEWATLSPEERQEKGKQAAQDIRGTRRKRLGDDDSDPLPPKQQTPAETGEPVLSSPGLGTFDPEAEVIDAEELNKEEQLAATFEEVINGEFVEAEIVEEERPYPSDWPKEAFLDHPDAFHDMKDARKVYRQVTKDHGSDRAAAWAAWEEEIDKRLKAKI